MSAAKSHVERTRSEWRRFRAGAVGRRFRQRYHRRQKSRYAHPPWLRAINIIGGLVLIGVGLVLAVMPGPAILFYAMGGALLASEFRWIAMALDRIEFWSRSQWSRWRRRE